MMRLARSMKRRCGGKTATPRGLIQVTVLHIDTFKCITTILVFIYIAMIISYYRAFTGHTKVLKSLKSNNLNFRP